jgi:hypothetical protein
MIVEIIADTGIGRSKPIVINASQIVVRQDNGTPIYVCAHYGPANACAHSMVGMDDFDRYLKVLGINMTVVVSKIALSGPPCGAKLLTGPTSNEGVTDGQ